MTLELDLRTGEPPRGVAGYFLVWLHCSSTPIVIYRSTLSTDWRSGMRAVRVEVWAGPLPEVDRT